MPTWLFSKGGRHSPAGGGPGASSSGAEAPDVSRDEIQAQLGRMLASKAFAHAERPSRFLRFIAEQTINGQGAALKEYLIGVEVFGRETTYDPRTDPIVRVEASRLRTRLSEYYEGEGHGDPVQIDLERGSYVPVFRRRQAGHETEGQRAKAGAGARWWQAAVVGLSLVAAVSCIAAIVFWRNTGKLEAQLAVSARAPLPPEAQLLWGPLLSSAEVTYVVFGSPMFFASGKHGVFVRHGQVNDPANFLGDENFRAMQRSLGVVTGPRYDYAEMGDTIALQRLTSFFAQHGASLSALPAHQAVWDTIKHSNIIFLGSPRMNRLLRSLPVELDFVWGPDDNLHNRKPLAGEEAVYTTPSHRQSTYAVIGSFPGLTPGREIVLLSTHSSPGAAAVVDFVTQPENIRALAERLGFRSVKDRKHFQVLVRVIADKNEAVKAEYVTHHLAAN